MTIQLTKTYEVLSEQTYTVTLEQEEYDEYLLQHPRFFLDEAGADVIDYEEMYDYFESKGHNVHFDEYHTDYNNMGVTVEFI